MNLVNDKNQNVHTKSIRKNIRVPLNLYKAIIECAEKEDKTFTSFLLDCARRHIINKGIDIKPGKTLIYGKDWEL